MLSSDAGIYTCQAESQAGTSVATATLTVHCENFTHLLQEIQENQQLLININFKLDK